jgi:hypothetical protein
MTHPTLDLAVLLSITAGGGCRDNTPVGDMSMDDPTVRSRVRTVLER